MRAIIIEDEVPALENLLYTVKQVNLPIEVVTVLPTVKEAIAYFEAGAVHADIIFSDVQLSDGLSFSIFDAVAIKTPVVFITGYDQFMMDAFEHNGIDYLLKPVDAAELESALVKYQMLQKHFTVSNEQAMSRLLQSFTSKRRSRLLVKKGFETIPLSLEDIVLFYLDKRIVYVVDKNSNKYIIDKTLTELSTELDEATFFRANRQYIVNIDYIKSYRLYERVKLQVNLTLPEIKHFIVVSQDMAPLFKQWMGER
ncbi:MAG TPA: LytTR family DNA-binding domain-containing protein [Flavisolibacter sp.]|nr:LytTR family DNA-binding domain-containing protein [Flavisolibacter sp.]